jgi:hypothetical protein
MSVPPARKSRGGKGEGGRGGEAFFASFRRQRKSAIVTAPGHCRRVVEGSMREIRVLSLIALAGFLAVLVIAPNAARANCYEIFGCTNSRYFEPAQLEQASWQILWEMRNWIYKENGYCFHNAEGDRGLRQYGLRA